MSSGNTTPSMSSSAAITSVWSRDFKRVIRNKSVLPSIFVIPAIFIAIFYGAFSRATDCFGISYATFLLPTGILQGLIFTAGGSSLAVAQDAEDGIHARIRTMPAPNWSLVAGRLLADLTRGAISIRPRHRAHRPDRRTIPRKCRRPAASYPPNDRCSGVHQCDCRRPLPSGTPTGQHLADVPGANNSHRDAIHGVCAGSGPAERGPPGHRTSTALHHGRHVAVAHQR